MDAKDVKKALFEKYPHGLTSNVLALEALNSLLVDLCFHSPNDPQEFMQVTGKLLGNPETANQVAQYFLAKMFGWVETADQQFLAEDSLTREVGLLDASIANVFKDGFTQNFRYLVEAHTDLGSNVLRSIAAEIVPLE